MFLLLGLSPDLQSMEQIRRIMRPTDVPDTGYVYREVCLIVLCKLLAYLNLIIFSGSRIGFI